MLSRPVLLLARSDTSVRRARRAAPQRQMSSYMLFALLLSGTVLTAPAQFLLRPIERHQKFATISRQASPWDIHSPIVSGAASDLRETLGPTPP
jgi:hypothetical protein